MRLVLKLGSSTLTHDGRLNLPRLIDYAKAVHAMRARGWQPVIVSSGAVAAGREVLGAPAGREVLTRQMYAAIGQPRLMSRWVELLGHYELSCAQVLLTRADLEHRRRYLNARHTLDALLGAGVVPVVNENDTVATEEIRVGDNDQLSALVATLIDAQALVLATDQDGLYSGDPRSTADARLIEQIDEAEFSPALWAAATSGAGPLGTGGMLTKLKAAELARRAGARVLITRGDAPETLIARIDGNGTATRISALAPPREARKRYILAGLRSGHEVSVDIGAERALHAGASLLAVGVTRVVGDFDRGDSIDVLGTEQQLLARGLANYSADEMRKIGGRRSSEIVSMLGYTFGPELIHRDDLVLAVRP